jgi:2-amino-4-hydroxy-6-hydroxymethyldihydropteridine diphosphokinase
VRASLADQAQPAAGHPARSLAIALGANLPSPAGAPLDTLLAVRPLLEGLLLERGLGLRWSPLFRTAPVGGPSGQPDYLNAAVLLNPAEPASPAAALALLAELQGLEQRFARQRRQHWGPRSLDLDLLWWGDLSCQQPALDLPHPRLLERSFVLAPLAAIDAGLLPPGAGTTAAALLQQLQADGADPAPVQLAGRPGWPD